MPRAIEQIGALVVAHAGLGLYGTEVGTVRQQVTDGDSVSVRALGDIGVRLLGIDAPELSAPLPGEDRFTPLSDPGWEEYLTNPESRWPEFAGLDEGLRAHLGVALGVGAAANQHRHAKAAEDALETAVEEDIAAMGRSEDDFRFFIAFAYELMDRYGRLLGFLNRDQPDDREPTPRPLSYNERLLERAAVSPYFIWPNVNPFRAAPSISDAVIEPGAAPQVAESDPSLARARASVGNARRTGVGLFEPADPLRLQPFEVRFLSRGQPPDRWIIDLGTAGDDLLPPQAYHTVANVEDRLFVPTHFVPLFQQRGWRLG
jgi:hypothetical protein